MYSSVYDMRAPRVNYGVQCRLWLTEIRVTLGHLDENSLQRDSLLEDHLGTLLVNPKSLRHTCRSWNEDRSRSPHLGSCRGSQMRSGSITAD